MMLSEEQVDRIRALASYGLTKGKGRREPGQMCAEAVVACALGLPHTDYVPCVAEPDARFVIRLNSTEWSSNKARGEGMLPLMLEHVGTAGTDRGPWVRALVDGTIRRIVPLALRAAANAHPDPLHQHRLEEAARACAVTGSRDAARSAERCAYDASDSAYNLAGVDSVAFRAANAAANAARVSADAASQNRSDRAAANEAAEAAEFASECVGDEALRDGVAVAIDAYRASSIVAEDRRAQYLAELRAEIRGLDAEVCEARVSIPLASPRTRT